MTRTALALATTAADPTFRDRLGLGLLDAAFEMQHDNSRRAVLGLADQLGARGALDYAAPDPP